MRNLAAKVPTDLWPEFEARATACYEAPSRAIVRQLTAGIRADYADLLPSALACFEDFETCIAHLKLPVTHRRFVRATNLLERPSVEERKRDRDSQDDLGSMRDGRKVRAGDLQTRTEQGLSVADAKIRRKVTEAAE